MVNIAVFHVHKYNLRDATVWTLTNIIRLFSFHQHIERKMVEVYVVYFTEVGQAKFVPDDESEHLTTDRVWR